MKKLTAGIFTSLIGLVSANTVSAAIASQGYVDSKIYALPSMEYITGNYQNLSQKLTPENYAEKIISIGKSDLYTSLAYTDATYEDLDNKVVTLPTPEENKDKKKLYPSLSLVESMLSSKEDTANKVSDFASIPANADLSVLYPSINATRDVAEDVIKNLGGTWQNESHYIHAAYYEIDKDTGKLRFNTEVESFLNLTPEQVRALNSNDPNEIKWGIAPNLRTVKLYVDDLKTYFDEQDELDEKLANKVTNAAALQTINDMTDETAKKTKKETSYPSVAAAEKIAQNALDNFDLSDYEKIANKATGGEDFTTMSPEDKVTKYTSVAAAEAIAQIALDGKENISNKVPSLPLSPVATSFADTPAGALVNSEDATTKYLSASATSSMISQKIHLLDYPRGTNINTQDLKYDRFITDIKQTDGIIQPTTARFTSIISDSLSTEDQMIAPQTKAVVEYAEALSNKVKTAAELRTINDMTDAIAKVAKKETSYPSVSVAEVIAIEAAQKVIDRINVGAANADDGKFFNSIGIENGAMKTAQTAFVEEISDTTKDSKIAPQTKAVVEYAEALSNKAGKDTTVAAGQEDTMYPTIALAEKIAAAAVEEALKKLQPIINVPAACSQPENYCVLTTNGTKFVWEVIARSTNDEKYPEPDVSTDTGSERLEVYTIPGQTSAN